MTPRSWLYVPGNRPDRLRKAADSGADALVVDLEDAVPPEAKEAARHHAAEFLSSGPTLPVFVRINAVDSPYAAADVAVVAVPGLAGVRVPKVEAPDQARLVVSWLARAGHPAVVHCLIESAPGVEASYAIATADPRVTGIGLGEADLRADLGVTGDAGLAWARSRVVVAARAAGLAAPVQSVHADVGDDAALRASCELGKAMGFHGRSAIHPRQLTVIHDVYRPSAAQIEAAREVVAAMTAALDSGAGSLLLPDGRFVDRAVAEGARRVLASVSDNQRENR